MPPQIQGMKLGSNDINIVNGKAIIPSRRPGMLLIYADWCPHCHHFIPIFNELCSKLGNDFPLMSVESNEISPTLNKALGFSGFPTIKFFDQRGNILSDYTGERTVPDILMYICRIYSFCVNK